MGRGPGVRATSATSIQIDFRYKGVRCRERLSLAPTPKNLKYAARLKATIDHEIATQTFDYAKHFPDSPRAQRDSAGAATSLRSALLSYCDSLSGQLEPETVDEYQRDAEIVTAGLKGKTVQGLTRADVRQWVSTLQRSKKRIDNLLIPLRGALNQAVDDGIIQSSPLDGFKVRRVRKDRDAIDPFTRSEIAGLAGTQLGHVWEFWAWTGLRSGELIGLRGCDLGSDFASLSIRRAVRVGREKGPKTERGVRVLDLLPPARVALSKCTSGGMDLDGPIFKNPNTGERWHEDRGLARAFRKACIAAGVRYRYPYQLRHTFASWALSSGENPLWVAKQMGHTDVTMIFRVYGKYMPSMNPDAGQKMLNGKAA